MKQSGWFLLLNNHVIQFLHHRTDDKDSCSNNLNYNCNSYSFNVISDMLVAVVMLVTVRMLQFSVEVVYCYNFPLTYR